MSDVLAASGLVQVLGVFFLVLALNRVRVPLGLGLAAGGVLVDLWRGGGAAFLARDLGAVFRDAGFWLLLLDIGLILEFGAYMASRANGQVMVDLASRLGGRRAGAWGSS